MSDHEQPGTEPNSDEPTAAAEGIGEQASDALQDGVLGKVAGMLPEGALDKVAGMLPEGALDKAAEMLDRDGDGNPLNDLKGLMGKLGGNG